MTIQTLKNATLKHPAALAYAGAFFIGCLSCAASGQAEDIHKKDPLVMEELNKQERKDMVQEFIKEGDRLAEQKDYNLANTAYESVFLLEPGNVTASKRIDSLKKKMVKEGKSEAQLVTHIYDEEIDMRVRHYLGQAKQFVERKKYGQARFVLQKLLLVNPLHQEANKLYEEVTHQLNKKAA